MAGASAPISTLSRLAFKDALLELEVAARKTREASSQAVQKLFQSAEKSLGVEVHRSFPINYYHYSYSYSYSYSFSSYLLLLSLFIVSCFLTSIFARWRSRTRRCGASSRCTCWRWRSSCSRRKRGHRRS